MATELQADVEEKTNNICNLLDDLQTVYKALVQAQADEEAALREVKYCTEKRREIESQLELLQTKIDELDPLVLNRGE